MTIKTIIFDMDGTIADTIPLTVFSLKETTKQHTGRILTNEEILQEFGPIDTEIIRKLAGDDSIEDYIKNFSDNFTSFVKPIDGMKELLDFIRDSGLKLGLFTGRSLRVTQIILEKLGYNDYFNEILAGDSTSNPKPDPEGILKILDLLDINSSNGVYVGDFDVDIMASKAAGTIPVLALWSTTASEELKNLEPEKSFKTPHEMIEWLRPMLSNKANH